MDGHRRAFTLFEMLVTISILSLVAVLVAPAMSDASGSRLLAGSSLLVSDMELAQVMSIAHPDDPVVVRFNAKTGVWWLAFASDPSVPMPRPDNGEPYLVQLGTGGATAAEGVTFTVASIPDDTLAFNAQGGVLDPSAAPRIVMTSGERSVTIDVATTTGTISENVGF